MKFTLLHPVSFDPSAIAGALDTEGISCESVRSPDQLKASDGPTVLVLDPTSRAVFDEAVLHRFVNTGGAIVALGTEEERDVPRGLREDLLAAYLPAPYGHRQLLVALRTAYREAAALVESARAQRAAASRTKEIAELTRIGMALSTERDYDALLDLILSQARQATSSDAGSLYIVPRSSEGAGDEASEHKKRQLRFEYSQNDSRPDIPLVTFTIPIDKTSIAGYVATTGEPLVIDDAYFLPPDVEYTFNRAVVDEKYGYRTKSLLTIPMADHKEEIIGVLQLINRKRDFDARLHEPSEFEEQVIPFTRRLVELVTALAGQAAVSIENSRLYEDIERLFEGFVRASVMAIEQRDPTTSGHSGRVAEMTVGLARTVDRAGDGPYRHIGFSRDEIRVIRYAGLLHDFGKVGVREQVLIKAKKLYPPDLSLVKQRYAFIRRTAEREVYKQRVQYLEQHGQEGYEAFVQRLTEEQRKQLGKLDRFMQLVLESNEPTVLPEGNFEELLGYANRFYKDIEGKEQPYLSDDEVRYLSIRKGSLDDTEREEIESHVTHTYRFLQKIPWTKELRSIPDIAWGHHEKLDGSGYPRQVKGAQIPIQTRMMTIADIFDALTAADRPYKDKVSADRALDIMAYEVEGGLLDQELFRLFAAAKVFEGDKGALGW